MNVYTPIVAEPMIERVIEDLCNDPRVVRVRVEEKQGGSLQVLAVKQ